MSTAGKIALATRTIGAVQRAMQVQRLERLLLVYDSVELGGNVVLVGLKVHEDIKAVKDLHLPPDQEDEMLQQIAMEAVQQGAMLAYATFSKAGEISSHLQAKIERSRYKSFNERGWVDEHGTPTEQAPPFLREHTATPGKAAGRAAQGEQAWKEAAVHDMAARQTDDGRHKLTVTEKGRIIRCTDYCTEICGSEYGRVPRKRSVDEQGDGGSEARAQQAAKSGNKAEADRVAADAAAFEGKVKHADDLRQHLFGMTDKRSTRRSNLRSRPSHRRRQIRSRSTASAYQSARRLIDVLDIMTLAELKELGRGG